MNASVFDRHKDEIELYEKMGKDAGRLTFAMAILSDVQAMTKSTEINSEINEAKELIVGVIRTITTITEALK